MKKKIAVYIIAILLLITVFTPTARAFDGNDYGGGDYGGGDYGGSDYGGSSYDWYDSGSSSDGSGIGTSMLLFVAVCGIYIIILSVQASSNRKRTMSTGGVRPSSGSGLHIHLPDRTTQIEGIIKGRDPNFSANDFISFAKKVYIDIQIAWCKRDMSPVRFLLHDNLYNATAKQVQSKIDQGVIYHYESMIVNTAYLTSYAKDSQFEYLTIYLNARMIDWQEDEKTGAILRGNKTTRWDLRYKMTFLRSIGQVTQEAGAGPAAYNCPNCGAPIELSSSAECEYCHSTVKTGQYSWVLSDFGTIRNDTIDEGIKVE